MLRVQHGRKDWFQSLELDVELNAANRLVERQVENDSL